MSLSVAGTSQLHYRSVGSKSVKTSSPGRADGSNRNVHQLTDLLVAQRGLAHQEPKELTAPQIQVSERQRHGAFFLGREDGRVRVLAVTCSILDVMRHVEAISLPNDGKTLAARRCRQPSRKTLRVSYSVDVVEQSEPRELEHIGSSRLIEAKPKGRSPNDALQALHQLAPSDLVSRSRLCEQPCVTPDHEPDTRPTALANRDRRVDGTSRVQCATEIAGLGR